jgi:ubiquitin thioesterase protein OTUB1
LVGLKEGLETLESEYVNDDIYQKKVRNLANKYEQIRRTRPDGNCFFRAFGFAYFEQLMYNKDKFKMLEEFYILLHYDYCSSLIIGL